MSVVTCHLSIIITKYSEITCFCVKRRSSYCYESYSFLINFNMKTSVKHIYTSVACNRTPEVVDWNEQGLICFGATNAVVIYDRNSKDEDPLIVLSHHTSKVNSVKWVRKEDGTCTELLSCSADKTAAIWTLSDGLWKVTSVLKGHEEGVNCIHGLYTGNCLIVFSGSIDSSVRVWERTEGVATLTQTINLHSGLCLTLHAALLPISNQPLLFCALDDHKIHVFAKIDEYHRVHMLIGHEDWVRGLDVLKLDNECIMLASASQDTYIRVWKIQKHIEETTHGIKVEQKVFNAYNIDWSVKLDAVLAGHEGWVYGVQWQSIKDSNGQSSYRILTSSLDKTLIIWETDNQGGAWVEKVRVGEVGGNGLGFYGSRFGPNSILAHGYNGSLHIWEHKSSNSWVPSVVAGGHFGGAEEVRWEGRGRYLASTALDQTTRVHAPWRRKGSVTRWHEIARPQVHGYDLSALVLVSPTTLVSAAEEKVIRVFRAPNNFLLNYRNIVGDTLEDAIAGPEGASVPSLGLSNKAVFSEGDQKNGDDNDGYFVPIELTAPPTEETLMQNTLWPETHKLYGHGYEVHCLAAAADGSLLASACRATNVEHAAVILWETENWQQIQKLPSHNLTVTQLAFSPDSQRLLSVSRDRRWTIFKRREGSNLFDLEACTDKTNGVHTRIIWCCAWSHDGQVFGTGSRDGKVCLWSKTGSMSETSLEDYGLFGTPLEIPKESVTALDFAPRDAASRILAVGFDSGRIRIYGFDGDWSLKIELDNSAAHHLTVRRLCFRPGDDTWLASCGSDHLVRIYSIAL
ncbi:probable elongator complex protein 2 [Aricia agestis]|uniref:probable elongator complex protein 2 n=1 Tax=Aricia agestis TaxID=91739 RepID=UPI001C2087B6|nr:probable elongator complex protein 2 [Aricia agestis]